MGQDLEQMATYIRRWSLKAIHAARSGHPGGSLSCADILAMLYGRVLRYEVDAEGVPIGGPDRDRFVLGKGHAAPALYAALAAVGVLDRSELRTLRQLGSRLEGHPHTVCPGVETPTGSLGQGFSVACGLALGLKKAGSPARVYCLLGDGELNEGIVWEAAMFAAHHKLDNLTAIVDYNKYQSDAACQDTMRLDPLVRKWAAFGWRVIEADGHNFDDLERAFDFAHAIREWPVCILAHTIKGKGVPFMQRQPERWHGSLVLTADQLAAALEALDD